MNLSRTFLIATSLVALSAGCAPSPPPGECSVALIPPEQRGAVFLAVVTKLEADGLAVESIDQAGTVIMVPETICQPPNKPSTDSVERSLKTRSYATTSCTPPIIIRSACMAY